MEESKEDETIRIPEIKIDKQILFHGSGVSGIKDLNASEETTVGRGLYLTSSEEAAKGYALRRAKRNPEYSPTTYTSEISNLTLADLRDKKAVGNFAKLLGKRLEEEMRSNSNLKWYRAEAIRGTLEMIKNDSFKSLKEITWNNQEATTRVLQDEGFDGLVTVEGGEGEEVGEHDSYVIFDPKKVKIVDK